jgi:hypothetical protein
MRWSGVSIASDARINISTAHCIGDENTVLRHSTLISKSVEVFTTASTMWTAFPWKLIRME